MDLDEAADQLYALLPEQFVEARNTLAKQAKSEGAAEVAARIKALRKPTLAAWLANQVAREHQDELRALADLGDEMRRAMSAMDGEKLRELTNRRKELVDGLLKQGRRLARGAGQKPTAEMIESLTETLLAAIADPRAADELRAGHLAHALQHVGFGAVSDDGEPAQVISLSEARVARGQRLETTRRPRRAGADAVGDTATEQEAESEEAAESEAAAEDDRDTAARELTEAEDAVSAAEDRLDDLEAQLDERRQRLEDAQAAVERLTAELADARRDVEQTRDDIESGEDDVDRARKDAEQARRRRRTAKQRLSGLDG
ncbi:hypothetical protein [Jiangella asiatica]|uniref:Uncharacterized protein n=1 Tax=Jiangella asiatica TaxID=2530372 RepID=A0A4R5CUG4_9ACTN|nr:hypothetical protein [Jiangella asiatica]TDE02591.1 hypothetical protein E1269_21655 [Jiangella asiatica]